MLLIASKFERIIQVANAVLGVHNSHPTDYRNLKAGRRNCLREGQRKYYVSLSLYAGREKRYHNIYYLQNA
jgi:hypothetical protein